MHDMAAVTRRLQSRVCDSHASATVTQLRQHTCSGMHDMAAAMRRLQSRGAADTRRPLTRDGRAHVSA
nr:hypothetical protein [Kibdelosporangium sp. MJ126-NF4]